MTASSADLPPTPFETLLGYAVFNGEVIDRLWRECTENAFEDPAELGEPQLWQVLLMLAGRWKVQVIDHPDLADMVRRYRRSPPEQSIRNAPADFERLTDGEQGIVVEAVCTPLLRAQAMERLARRCELFGFLHHRADHLQAARVAQELLFGMHCHVGLSAAASAQEVLEGMLDAFVSAAAGTPEAETQGVPAGAGCAPPDRRWLAFKAKAGAMLAPLVDAAWVYERAVSQRRRYFAIAPALDDNAVTRAELDEDARRHVAAIVQSDSPDRFKWLVKAMLGDAARKLTWQPPDATGQRISVQPASEAMLRRCARVLAMVHELHKAGYQRLRVLPFASPSGCYWRAWITHASNVAADGYTLIDWDLEDTGRLVARYTSGQENDYFGWTDAKGKSARELAVLFQERYPQICAAAVGLDWAYAGWLTDVLGHAERGELVCLIEDMGVSPQYLHRWQPPPP